MSTVNNGPQIVRSGLVLDLDASYMRSYSPNVHPNPTNIFAWSGTGNNNCTLSGDSSITRQYGSIPLKMVMTGTDPYTGTYNVSTWNLAPAANGQTWTLSFYAKGSETLTGNCYIFGANSSGNYIEAFATSFTVTNTWQRFSLTSTFSNASTVYIQIRFGGASSQVGKTIWWDGVQVERASSATTFNPYYIGNTSWRDVSGNGYNGTLTNGPTFNSSNGGIIVFDGTDDYILTNLNQNVDNTSITWEAWFWDDSSGGFVGNTAIISNYGPNPTTPYTMLHISSDGYPFVAQRNSTGTEDSVYYSSNVCNSVWHHLVATIDSNNMYIYVDGVLRGSKTRITGVTTSGQNIVIGGNHLGRYQSCRMAGVRIYNKALTSTEVTQNYNATKSRFGL